MHTRFTTFFIALLTALFCTAAFSTSLPDAGQGLSYEAADPSWFDGVAGSESLTQEPMLLASKSNKSKKSNKSNKSKKNKYCRIKENKKGKIKYKDVKLTDKKLEKKCDKGWVFVGNCPTPTVGKCKDIVTPS